MQNGKCTLNSAGSGTQKHGFRVLGLLQQVLEYRDKGVQKFQKIPIFEFSGSLQSTY